MKLRTLFGCAVAAITVGAAASASAAVSSPVPTSAYITYNGLDWAWANPLPDTAGNQIGSYQISQGWRAPTPQELAYAPLATQFLFPGANVPYNGTDPVTGGSFSFTNADYTNAGSAGACASGYFGSGYTHCDWGEGNGQPYAPWAGSPNAGGSADQLYVRGTLSVGGGGGVPEPATWTSLIVGFGMMGAAMRRRRTVAAR